MDGRCVMDVVEWRRNPDLENERKLDLLEGAEFLLKFFARRIEAFFTRFPRRGGSGRGCGRCEHWEE